MAEAAETKARTIVATALAVPLDAVPAEADMATLPQWDSIGHMTIVLGVEEALGRRLPAEEIVSIGSVGDIARLLEQPA